MKSTAQNSRVEIIDHASFLLLDRGEVDSEILLVEKKEEPGVWGLPGGQGLPNEPFDSTMWRETLEEVGVTMENPAEIFRTLVEDPTTHLFIVFGGFVGYMDIKNIHPGKEIGRVAFFNKRGIEELIAAGLVRSRHARAIREYWQTRCY